MAWCKDCGEPAVAGDLCAEHAVKRRVPCRATWKGCECAYELGHTGEHWTITKDGEEAWSTCSDCGRRNVEEWSPYARYCYRCGSKGCADVNAPWLLEAGEGIEVELVLLAVHHRDGSDQAPRALQWLRARLDSAGG